MDQRELVDIFLLEHNNESCLSVLHQHCFPTWPFNDMHAWFRTRPTLYRHVQRSVTAVVAGQNIFDDLVQKLTLHRKVRVGGLQLSAGRRVPAVVDACKWDGCRDEGR